jgi:hypothetical protein
MERGHIFISIAAPAATEGITFQCFVANTEEGGERLRAGFRALRERLGFPLLQTGFSSKEGFGEEGLRGESGGGHS